MDKRRLKVFLVVLAAFVALSIAIVGFVMVYDASAEEEERTIVPLIVVADTLNGRYRPNRQSPALAEYEFGDELIPTGKWSKDRQWVQVYHPEENYVWVNINYVSERVDIFEVSTLNDSPIRVRSKPGAGKTKKYLKKNELVEITQVVMGYGRCEWGWIDLSYFIEEPQDDIQIKMEVWEASRDTGVLRMIRGGR